MWFLLHCFYPTGPCALTHCFVPLPSTGECSLITLHGYYNKMSLAHLLRLSSAVPLVPLPLCIRACLFVMCGLASGTHIFTCLIWCYDIPASLACREALKLASKLALNQIYSYHGPAPCINILPYCFLSNMFPIEKTERKKVSWVMCKYETLVAFLLEEKRNLSFQKPQKTTTRYFCKWIKQIFAYLYQQSRLKCENLMRKTISCPMN